MFFPMEDMNSGMPLSQILLHFHTTLHVQRRVLITFFIPTPCFICSCICLLSANKVDNLLVIFFLLCSTSLSTQFNHTVGHLELVMVYYE